MSKPYVSEREYSRRASILKKFRLIDYNLKEKLNNAQKAQITKLTRHHIETVTDKNGNTKELNRPPLKALIEKPELFKTRKVNKKQAEKWRNAGYKVINGHVLVRGEPGASIKIHANRIELHRKEISEDKYLFIGIIPFLKAAKKLFNKKLKVGEYVMIGVGKYGIFHNIILDFETLENYLNEVIERYNIDKDTVELQLVHHYRNKRGKTK